MKVGIDLGTTNSALAWIDPDEAEDTSFPPIHIFDIPQLVAPGRIEPRRTLPSFLYLEGDQPVGTYAREQGAIVPTRLVHSAKSWLSNPDVDRTAKILPWDAGEGGRVLSPVEVSARLLSTMHDAWDKFAKHGPLSEQQIVLTVPASFDEEARELTVQAAHDAGIEQLTLLEEPAAAFYSWIANNFARSRKLLFDGQVVLICDVGGGTSDFSLIRVARDGDKIDFTRTAVGKHLLLGGDNLDLTLAWLAETKLGKQLSIRQRSGLRRECSAAKEILLCDPHRQSVEINVLGSGSSMIGGTLKTEITRAEALELALDGFLPITPRGEMPKEEKRSLFRELGLPYVSDPAISRHLAAFLESANQVPDAILFNGGFFIPEILRERVADVLANWYGKRPEVFENRDLDLAVASGAAYYSYVRSTGAGVLVRGGLPRAYYVGFDDNSAVCLLPRGAEEGDSVEIDREGLQLIANKPVAFRLLSSLTRSGDQAGEVVRFAEGEDIHSHAPLEAVIRFGKGGERLVPVKLGARLTETGTLETWCDSKISDNRWRLQFQIRKSAAKSPSARRPAAVVSTEAVEAACELVRDTFTKGSVPPEELPARLEAALGLGRNSWPVEVARRLADVFLELVEARGHSAACEVRWLNLGGFCLRPGFGFIGDDFRIEQSRRIYSGGLKFGNQTQNEIDWWIFWGRLAGGLNRNQQSDIVQRLLPVLLPKVGTKPQRVNSSLLREMWRAASSMELIPAANRIQLGDALIKQGKHSGYTDNILWCIARLGARQLFYGPTNQVLAPAIATRWIEALIAVPKAEDVLVSLARKTGDPVRDVAAATFTSVRDRITHMQTDPQVAAQLDGDAERDEGRIFGEALPSRAYNQRVKALIVTGLLALTSLSAQTYKPDWDSLDKRPTPAWFSDAKFGIFIHWGVYSVPGYAPVIPGKLAYAEWYWNAMTNGRDNPKATAIQTGTWDYHKKMYGADFPYQDLAAEFKAELFDPDHWADVFQRSGAKYVAITSKHHEGFALWPSKEASATWGRPWNAVETGPKRDLLGDLTDAVRRKGLHMGFYYSLYEWYNPLWLSDKPRYISQHMIPQFKDVVTRYKPDIIFADGEWDLTSAEWHTPEMLAWLFNESPVKDTVVINDRWGKDTRHKHGGYWTTEYTPGMADINHPWEESRGMGFSYGYNRAESLNDYHSSRELLIMLVDLVSRGGNLLLDIGPNADGTIPVIMEERLIQMGSWLKINGDAIYGTRPWKTSRQLSAGDQAKVDYNKEFSTDYDVTKVASGIEAFFTQKGNDVYAILPRWPGGTFRVKDVTGVKSVTLLGSTAPVKFSSANGVVSIQLPELSEDLRPQPAWVLKLSR